MGAVDSKLRGVYIYDILLHVIWTQVAERTHNKKSRTYGTSDSFAKINVICQICQRVRSVRESDLWGRVGQITWLSDSHGLTDLRVRSASHAHRSDYTGRESDPRGYLTDFTAKRIASAGRVRSVCVRGRSDSQICEADLWGWSVRLWESESHVICQRVRSASQIWESDQPQKRAQPLTHTASHSRVASHAHRSDYTGRESDPRGYLTDFTAKRIASAGRVRSVCVRGRSAVGGHVRERPIGLSNLWGRVRERPCSLLIGSDRSHDKLWEAVLLSLA